MSTGQPSQPPAASDKSRAPKGPISTSAFINKGGKSFAPKAVRRRLGAAAPASKPTASAASTAPQPSQTQTAEEANATPSIGAGPPTAAQLPTPAATQDANTQSEKVAEQAVSGPVATLRQSSPPTVGLTQIVPASSLDVATTEQKNDVETVPPQASTEPGKTQSFTEELGSRPSSEQPILRAPQEPRAPVEGPSAALPEPTPTEQIVLAPMATSTELPNPPGRPLKEDAPSQSTEPVGITNAPTQTPEAQGAPAAKTGTPALHGDGSLTQQTGQGPPWTAVNTAQKSNENDKSTPSGSRAKPRRRRKPITLREIDEEEREGEEQERPRPARPKRASATSRAKRAETEVANEDEAEDAAPPAKKARKPRKDKGKKRATVEGEENEDDDATRTEPQPKKRRKKKQNAAQTEGANEGQDGAEAEQQPKVRGRPPREPTPSDAENEVIDPDVTLMNSIASRNIRVGKLSEREKQMRLINWDEVKQARRDKEKYQTARENQEEMERIRKENEVVLDAAGPQPGGPRYVEVDGQIVMKAGTGQIDEEAEAQRAHDAMEVVVEDDLTNQVNARSFLRNNKRFPNEFLLPGQGKQWSLQDTEDFYRAMSIFGTDFAMMESLFPGVGRKSIKKKFNREERRDPQRVKETLHAQLNNNWEEYLELTGRADTDFADVDNIKAQLEAEANEMQIAIDKAKKEAEERKRQRRIAGIESEDEAAGDKEHKGKKGKRANKKVGFELAADEEVIGTVGDDDDWGKE